MLVPTLSLLLLLLYPFLTISTFTPICAPESLLPVLLSDCLRVRTNMIDMPYAYSNITWSETRPGRLGNLPKRWKHDTCQVKLALLWPGSGATARFRLMTMAKFIDEIMGECVVGGPQRGGAGAFGTDPVVGNVMVISVMGIRRSVAVDETGADEIRWIDDLREFDVKHVDGES